MWSETFTDSYGTKWTLRKAQDWSTVQLLVTDEAGPDEPAFSYGLTVADFGRLAEIVRAAEVTLGGELAGARYEAERQAELEAGRDPRD